MRVHGPGAEQSPVRTRLEEEGGADGWGYPVGERNGKEGGKRKTGRLGPEAEKEGKKRWAGGEGKKKEGRRGKERASGPGRERKAKKKKKKGKRNGKRFFQ
jgi:hypothetical protein